MQLEIYTDGSLKGKCGSWAYIIVKDGIILNESSGRVKASIAQTSNRMEFQAAINALKALPPHSKGILYSDSRNLIDTINLWKNEWKRQGWLKKYSKPILELDLVLQLDELNDKHFIEWKWVRSHAGHPFNERCDFLCIQARIETNESL